MNCGQIPWDSLEQNTMLTETTIVKNEKNITHSTVSVEARHLSLCVYQTADILLLLEFSNLFLTSHKALMCIVTWED